jgi:RNA polymerase subunit RPABC4/transcription elongation factor Spt4
MYLVSGNLSEPCPLLPYETEVCPTCGTGIKPARGYTWVDVRTFMPAQQHGTPEHNAVCPFGQMDEHEPHRCGERAGLIWVGAMHYPTPQSFMREAAEMGVSRRITQVPRDFVVGETWVLLGHAKAIEKACPECGDEVGGDAECPECDGVSFVHRPGIITAFRPTAIEYIVKGDETDEEIEALEKRGITPVKVERIGEQEALVE